VALLELDSGFNSEILWAKKDMRLTKQQIQTITQTVSRLAGTGASVYLFGSRLNDQAKGGDIDLFIESDTPLSIIHRAQIKTGTGDTAGLTY